MRPRHILAGLAVVAFGPGQALAAWSSPVWISPRGSSVYSSPEAAVSAGGRALAVWVRAPAAGGAGRVEAAWRDGARADWGAPRTLSGLGARAPRAAVNPRGDAVVAWRSGRDVVAALRRGPRGRWATDRVVRAAEGVRELRVAIDGRGRPSVIWSERRGNGFLVRLATRVTARGWRVRPAELATPGPDAPALALSGGAGALVAWVDRGRAWASRTVAGEFERAVELAPEASRPVGVVLSPGGSALAAWGAALPGGSTVVLGADRAAAVRGWGAPEDLGIGTAPQVALNDRGDAVVAWSLDPRSTRDSRGIEAGTRRRSGGWRSVSVVPRQRCSCVLRVGGVAIAGSGEALVSWRRDEGLRRGGGAATGAVSGSPWSRWAAAPDRLRDGPAVAAGAEGGLAVWTEPGPGAGVRAAATRP